MHRVRAPHAALAAAMLLAGCGSPKPAVATAPRAASEQAVASTPAAPVATNSVNIQNFEFSPAAITVPVGTTVTWTDKDVEQHTVTARDKAFNSDIINNERTYSYTFGTAGSFEYFCLIHPHMTGTVMVTDK
jgi:plastocyanin